jgi:hypothetical protein
MKFQVKVRNKRSEFNKLQKKLLIETNSNDSRRVSALKRELEDATPVDTGEAKAGWSIRKTLRGFDVINDVDHIVYLNEGSSKQAPAHFVERTALKHGTPKGAIVRIVE